VEIEVSQLPDFEGLAIFAKVVQTHSFVGAADELRLSKATVSKAVSRIEKRFGTRLFNRTARRLALTQAGRELYDRAAQILAEGEAAENEVIAQSAVPRGHVRLTAPVSYGVRDIAPILPEFLALYPDITIDLHLSDAHIDLVGEGYDAAIRIASLPDSSLIARTLSPVSRYLVAAPNYLSKQWPTAPPASPHRTPVHCLHLDAGRNLAFQQCQEGNGRGAAGRIEPTSPKRAARCRARHQALPRFHNRW
jgi:DNA-binding transcriptional LysR family regulator